MHAKRMVTEKRVPKNQDASPRGGSQQKNNILSAL
jgi:hypothetical protein